MDHVARLICNLGLGLLSGNRLELRESPLGSHLAYRTRQSIDRSANAPRLGLLWGKLCLARQSSPTCTSLLSSAVTAGTAKVVECPAIVVNPSRPALVSVAPTALGAAAARSAAPPVATEPSKAGSAAAPSGLAPPCLGSTTLIPAPPTEGMTAVISNTMLVPEHAGAETLPSGGASGPTARAETESAGTGLSPATSSPSCAPAKGCGARAPEDRETRSAGAQLGNLKPVWAPPPVVRYPWVDSRTDAVLLGRGLISYHRRTYVAVDVVRDGMTIARMSVALSHRPRFFQFFKVWMAHRGGGRQVAQWDTIASVGVGDRYVFYVGVEELEKVAPMTSFRESLKLRKNLRWSLPPDDGRRNFAIRCSWEDVVCFPMVVDIRRRKTSEPLVKVHWYAWHKADRGRKLQFYGEGYMSWYSAIVLARCSRLGAKIALPNGSWTRGELDADVKVSPDGKREYGMGLRLQVGSLPEGVRLWAAGFSDIFALPLSDYCDSSEFDWTRGAACALKARRRKTTAATGSHD